MPPLAPARQVWEPYRAARAALDTALPSAAARRLTELHASRLAKLRLELPRMLLEGVLDEEYLLVNQARCKGRSDPAGVACINRRSRGGYRRSR